MSAAPKPLIAFALSLALAACGTDQREEKDPRIAAGAALFAQKCSECHPRSGRGNFLKRLPATLLRRRSETQLVTWIQGRDQHREMPSFIDLSQEELESLAAFLIDESSRH